MAKPLPYETAPAPEPIRTSAEVELQAFLETLHTSGALRLLRGMLGAVPEVSDVVLEQMATESGKNLLGNVSIAMMELTKTEPDATNTFLGALRKSVRAARASMLRMPPSLMELVALMMHEDTRRGLHACLTLLATLGRELRRAGWPFATLTAPIREHKRF